VKAGPRPAADRSVADNGQESSVPLGSNWERTVDGKSKVTREELMVTMMLILTAFALVIST